MLATTKTNLNEWVTVKANVKEDFKKFHNLDVNEPVSYTHLRAHET